MTDQQSDQQSDQRSTSDRPAIDQRSTSNRPQRKKEKNEEKGIPLKNDDVDIVIDAGTARGGAADEKIVSLFKRYGMPVSEYACEKMSAILAEYGEERVETALKEAAQSNTSSNGLSFKFFEAVLRGNGKHSLDSDGGDYLPWRE